MESRITLLVLSLAFAVNAADPNPRGEPIVAPQAVVETKPVPHSGDAADDPAIWHHPSDPAKSLILGTDKQGGLIVYDLDGAELQTISPEARPNNVDVTCGFKLANGKTVDLAVGSTRGSKHRGAMVWSIDADTRRLADITADGVIKTPEVGTPYGICTYRSAKSGKHYFFVNNYFGQVAQYELQPKADNTITATKVRTFKLASITEGMVADDETGFVYIAEEDTGIWKASAEPDNTEKPALIIRVGENGLKADVEGLAIYAAAGGKGYLIVSSQGNNTFKIYRRDGNHEFIGTIDPKAGKIDDVNDTDGIAVTNRPLGANFPKGCFIVQDGSRPRSNQNFKAYRWEDIATDKLLIDPSHSFPQNP